MSALPIPSGNRTASSSWSRVPTGTTHSFHIVLTGGEVGGREGRGKGASPLPRPECPRESSPTTHPISVQTSGLNPLAQRHQAIEKEPPKRWLGKVNFLLPHPSILSPDFNQPLCSGLWALCHPLLTRTAALHGAVGCRGTLGTGWVAAALVQVQAFLTLGAEVVAEAGLTVLNLAF